MSYRLNPPVGTQRQAPSCPLTLHRLSLGLVLAALTACGSSGDDEPEAPSVSVTPSLGQVTDADVSLTCAATNTVLATGSTGSSGQINLSASGSCTGPVLVTITGRADGSSRYFDEALASQVVFPAGASLRAVAPSLDDGLTLAVTPLTEVAAQRALTVAGGLSTLTATQVNSANTAVVTQVLGAGVSLNILTPPTLWHGGTATGSLGNTDADRYAFYLAGLAKMASGSSQPALDVTEALRTDLADGTLDGGTVGSFSYSPSSLATQLGDGLQALATYANAELQTALNLAVNTTLTLTSFGPTSGKAGDTITLVGTGFDPDPFHMEVKFSNNLTAEVVSSSATQVVVIVPAGAVTGPITVTRSLVGGSVTSSSDFTVTGGGGGSSDVWVSRASPTGLLLYGLAYGNGRFVATGYNRTLISSTDGLSWTASTPPDTAYYQGNAVTWTGSQFVMVGDMVYGGTTPALLATSPDGLTWTRRTWTTSTEYEALMDVGVGGGKITVVGNSGSIASSTDNGVTWSKETTPGYTSFLGIAGNDTVRVAVGRNGSYEGVILVDSGSGWTTASGVTGFVPRDVTWTGTQFVAVGGTSSGLSSAAVATSSDGTEWTVIQVPTTVAPSNFPLLAVLYHDGTLYATGDNLSNKHIILQSTDEGASWTLVHEATTSGIAMLAGIAASDSRIVTVGGVKSVTLP